MLDTIFFNKVEYPKLQSEGFASQYAFPFAKKILTGDVIYDIGYCNSEWMYPGAIGIDITKGDGFEAMKLPPLHADGIFSSHCLEHLPNYVDAINYWHSRLKHGGVLFLYLPNCDYQEYWRPWSNRKHIHHMTPRLMQLYFQSSKSDMWQKYFVTEGYDLNGSFYVVAQKHN